MRVSDDFRECVFFVGNGNGENFKPAGTAFFFGYDGHRYIVTARHIAELIGDAPFVLRLNKTDGASLTVNVDPQEDVGFKWIVDEDKSVDLAVAAFNYDLKSLGVMFQVCPSDALATKDHRLRWNIGAGDTCYAIGLFSLLYGAKRNLPVVHTGSIACVPEDERILVQNWNMQDHNNRELYVSGFLVEMQNLSGLSGAPVFVRNSVPFGPVHQPSPSGGNNTVIGRLPDNGVSLLGVWQSSWDAPATRASLHEHGSAVRVPVGMGVVVPADALLSLLNTPSLAEPRRLWREKQNADLAARLDEQA